MKTYKLTEEQLISIIKKADDYAYCAALNFDKLLPALDNEQRLEIVMEFANETQNLPIADVSVAKRTLPDDGNIIGWIKDDFENQVETFVKNPNFKGNAL